MGQCPVGKHAQTIQTSKEVLRPFETTLETFLEEEMLAELNMNGEDLCNLIEGLSL